MLAYQQKESTARVAPIMENTNLSKQQQVSEIMRQMLTQAQTAGQYFTNDQIKEMTRKVSAEADLVHQQTQNQRYGSSHIGATAKDISNVVTEERRVQVAQQHVADPRIERHALAQLRPRRQPIDEARHRQARHDLVMLAVK